MAVQWLRLPANTGDLNSILSWGTKIPHAAWHSQKNKIEKMMITMNVYSLATHSP